MLSSTAVLGAMGLVLVLAPGVVAAPLALGGASAAVMLQLYGGAMLGFASSTWVGRGMAAGGIFGRSLVMGQFAHALIGTLVLVREVVRGAQPFLIGALLVYALLALAFGSLLFGETPSAKAG